jgi:two-component system, sensor histidine kinase and response regulator
MSSRRHRSIRRKLTRIVLVTCGASILLACTAIAAYDVAAFRRELSSQLATVAQITGSNLTAALAFGDPKSATETLGSLAAQPHIVQACVYSTDEGVFASYARDRRDTDCAKSTPTARQTLFASGYVSVSEPIQLNGERLGTILVKSDLEALHSRTARFIGIIAVVSLLSIVTAYLLASRLQRVISSPIVDLAETATAISVQKDYSLRAEKRSNDEIGSLVDRFNEMLSRIQDHEAALRSARDELEVRVDERTSELRREIAERKQTEQELAERESFLDSLIKNTPVGIVAINTDHSIKMCNSAFERLFRYRQQDILGKSLTDLLSPPTLRAEVEANSAALWQGKTIHLATRRKRSDGSLVDVEAFSVPLGPPGQPTGGLLLYHDITERKQAERALEERTVFLNSLVENSPLAIVVTDLKYRVQLCNPAFEKLFGYRKEEALGRPLPEILADDAAAMEMEANRKVLVKREQEFVRSTTRRRREDGTMVDVEVFGVPLKIGDVNVGGLILYQDITERKQAEEALLRAKEAAEAASKAKSEFLANMSHEIRTPMNGIIGMTELTLDTTLTPEQREYLDMVKASAHSLMTVINDILDFSKIEAGKLEVEMADFPLQRDLGETLKALAFRAHQKGLELAWRIGPGIPENLRGDVGRLRQVLVNLVGNAVKFTERGEVVVSVEKEAEDDRGITLHFQVRDTGIGIPKEKQQVIFDAFTQADSSASRKYGGTGLGLAISSRLVQLIGGRIWVESEVERGSTFHFTARLGFADRPDQPVAADDQDLVSNLPVLVVDDNETNRRILVEQLSRWGMRPEAVDGGTAAFSALLAAHLEDRPFRLVISDMRMPGMDGCALAQRIRATSVLADVPILMLSSSGLPGEATRCSEVSISAYLTKPVQPSELLDAIMSALFASAAETEQPAPKSDFVAAGTGGMKVLLVEDNTVNRKLAATLLEKHGYTVIGAENGKEALKILDREAIDTVFMDVQMPVMNGFEAIGAIRAKEQVTGTHMPIIAMTAHAMKGDRERCLAAGADDYVAKPIRPRELLDAIDRVATKRIVASVQPMAEPWRALNVDAALAHTEGDRDLLEELCRLLAEECPRNISALRAALGTHDMGAVARLAHTIRGAAVSVGASRLSQAAFDVEQRANAKASEALPGLIDALQADFDRLLPELEALCRKAVP